MRPLDATTRLTDALQRATTPALAAQTVLDWLSEMIGPAALGLLGEQGGAEVHATADGWANDAVLRWLRQDQGWWTWTRARLSEDSTALMVPLMVGAQSLGLLWQALPRGVSVEGPVREATLVAGVLAGQLRHLRTLNTHVASSSMMRTMQHQAARQSAAASLARNMLGTRDPDRLLESTATLLVKLLGYARVDVVLGAEVALLRPALSVTLDAGRLPTPATDTDVPLAAQALAQGRAALAAGYNPATRQNHARVAVPMTNTQPALGVLVACAKPGTPPDNADIELLQSAADQLALALDSARLYSQLKARADDLSNLARASLAVSATLDLERLADHTFEGARSLLDPDVFAFVAYDAEARSLYSIRYTRDGTRAQGGAVLDVQRSLAAQVVARCTPVFWRTPQERATLAVEYAIGDMPYAAFMAVPLLSQGDAVGVLWAASATARAFDDQTFHLLLTFASHVAVTLSNSTLLSTTARRAQELGVLNDISHTLARSVASDNLWGTLGTQMSPLFEHASLLCAVLVNGQFTFPLAFEDGRVLAPPQPQPGEGLLRAVLDHNTLLSFPDLSASHERLSALGVMGSAWPPLTHGARSWMGAPLRGRNQRALGVLVVMNALPYQYDDAALMLLRTVAAQLSLALENQVLLAAERRRREVAEVLMDVARVVGSTLQLEQVLERVLEQLRRLVDYDGASVMLVPEGAALPADGMVLIISASRGDIRVRYGSVARFTTRSLVSQAVLARAPFVQDDVRGHPGWDATVDDQRADAVPTRAWVGAPMFVRDRLIGFLSVDAFTPNFYADADAQAVYAVAQQAAIAVDNARLHERLRANLRTARRRARRLATIHAVARATALLDRDALVSAAAERLTRLYGARACLLAVLDDDEQALRVVYPLAHAHSFPLEPDVLARIRGPWEPGVVTQADVDATGFYAIVLQTLGIERVLVAPLANADHTFGVLALDLSGKLTTMRRGDTTTIAVVARQLSAALTNAQLYEQALDANRLKTEFLGTISHELRTPLNAIVGFSDMLAQGVYGPLNERQAERLGRLVNSSQHLLALIDQLLDLSKLEAGRFTLHKAPLDVFTTLQEALADLTPMLDAKHLALAFCTTPDLPPVAADARRVRQVLTNLLSNAVKFTASGHVRVNVFAVRDGVLPPSVQPQHPLLPQNYLALQVCDTGIGIAPNDQRTVFEAFRQVDGSTSREYTGTGLGLAIASRLVAQHDGHLWLHSTPGEGSVFTVLLPGGPTLPPLSDVPLPGVLVQDEDPSVLMAALGTYGTQRPLAAATSVALARALATEGPIGLAYVGDQAALDALRDLLPEGAHAAHTSA